MADSLSACEAAFGVKAELTPLVRCPAVVNDALCAQEIASLGGGLCASGALCPSRRIFQNTSEAAGRLLLRWMRDETHGAPRTTPALTLTSGRCLSAQACSGKSLTASARLRRIKKTEPGGCALDIDHKETDAP
jgi:hypothetical protein